MNDHRDIRELLLTALGDCGTLLGHGAAVAVLSVATFGVDHLLLEMGDPKLYDKVPWRYVFETGDLALVITLVAVAVSIIRGAER